MTKYFLMVFAGGCSYGVLSTIVKLAYLEGYTTAELSFLQALTGMLVLGLILFFKTSRLFKSNELSKNNKTPWVPLLVAGGAIGLTSFVYYLSVQYIPASIAIIILMQFTWIGILLDWLCFKKRPGQDQVMAILLILTGTVMASNLLGHTVETLSIKGLALAFCAALFFAIYVVVSSSIKTSTRPLKKSMVMMLGSAILLFIINAQTIIYESHYDAGLIKWVLLLAVFGTIIPPLVFSNGIPKIGVGYSSILMTAELPVAVVCAQLILKESVNPLQWLGILLILLSIIWLKLKNRKQ